MLTYSVEFVNIKMGHLGIYCHDYPPIEWTSGRMTQPSQSGNYSRNFTIFLNQILSPAAFAEGVCCMRASEIPKLSTPMRYSPATWPGRCGAPLCYCPKQTQLSVVRQLLNIKSKANPKPNQTQFWVRSAEPLRGSAMDEVVLVASSCRAGLPCKPAIRPQTSGQVIVNMKTKSTKTKPTIVE